MKKMKCFQPEELYWAVVDQLAVIRLPIFLGKEPKVAKKIIGRSNLAAVCVSKSVITISIPHLVHLWSASQQYYLYYSAIRSLALEGETNTWNLDDLIKLQPGLENAMDQYSATRSDIPYGKKIEKYEGRQVCCEDEHSQMITTVCATALLWVLLHETAHLELNHPQEQLIPEFARREEEEADRRATELFFMLAPDTSLAQFNYGFGLLIALVELFPPEPKKVGPTYPEYHERLAARLFDLDPENNHELYGLAALLLEEIAKEWGISPVYGENIEVKSPHDLREVVMLYYRALSDLIKHM